MTALVAVVQFLTRLALAVALALVLALALAAAREDGGYGSSFETTCFVLGCLTLLLAVAGNSPSRRLGTVDPWLASFFPKLTGRMGEAYSGTTLSASALLSLTAPSLLALGFLVGR